MKSQIVLIGYRGSGKTTIGRVLAEQLGWPFVDADVYLEAQAGKTIREIFATEGEQSFRDRESSVLRELSNQIPLVLATGGGIILREENRGLIRQAGLVVWLSAEASVLWERMQTDVTTQERRPNLAGGGIDEVIKMLAVRTPIYQSLAKVEIPVGELSPVEAANRILAEWNGHSKASQSPDMA